MEEIWRGEQEWLGLENGRDMGRETGEWLGSGKGRDMEKGAGIARVGQWKRYGEGSGNGLG